MSRNTHRPVSILWSAKSLCMGSLALAFAAISGCASLGSLAETPNGKGRSEPHQVIPDRASRGYESPIPRADNSHRILLEPPTAVERVTMKSFALADAVLSGMTKAAFPSGPSHTTTVGLDSLIWGMPATSGAPSKRNHPALLICAAGIVGGIETKNSSISASLKPKPCF